MRDTTRWKEALMDFKGKKILFLGSNSNIARMVLHAKKMGLYTIVTDNKKIEEAPAKRVADKIYNISIADLNSLLCLIKQEKISGVLTGYTDSYLRYYLDICMAANLPCYGNSHTFKIATDKSAFKQACINSGVPVIPGEVVQNRSQLRSAVSRYYYPFILKPIDNSGSRGVVLCQNQDELEYSYDYAMRYSDSKKLLLEKYMTCKSMAVSYFALNGKVELTSTCDRGLYVSNKTGSSITSYTEYPSKYTDRYIAEVNSSVVKMLQNNGFNNGMIALQAFVDEESFYFCEMCYRPSGGHHYSLIYDQNRVDEMSAFIEYAIAGSSSCLWDYEKETPYFSQKCAMVKVIGIAGEKISKFDGIDLVRAHPSVIEAYQSLNVGDTIGADGTTLQILAPIWYRCDNSTDPKKLAREIASLLDVENEQRQSLTRLSVSL